jgi:predicted nuclease of predicted toxin-antitoxin system
MTLWLDAQLPPALARWINEQPWGVEAVPVREIGLRDASDPEIFRQARAAAAVVMTKDRDFIRLLDEEGPPPQVIWLRVGNSSNAALQQVLATTLPQALELLHCGEPWVEIRPQANAGY